MIDRILDTGLALTALSVLAYLAHAAYTLATVVQ